MNANGQLIETLASSPVFEEYSHAYTDATGLPVAIRPLETWRLPFQGRKGENPWCCMMAGKNPTCAACLQMQDRLVKSAVDSPNTITCGFGLTECAVPIKLGAETIGYLQTGQTLQSRPTEASFRRAIKHARSLEVEFDETSAREAYFSTPVVSKKKMASVARLLSIFAEHLSMISNQIAVQTANAEPPVITRARQYIEEHHAEDLCLDKVAQAVHTSLFYFCKLFKKVTGVNFTEYVSRVRTEKAKNLLLNPNARVTEVAYGVGFQSLTHFNRVFKKVVGESPTEYRNRLPSAV